MIQQYFYVSVIDGDSRALLMGPYLTHAEARKNVYEAKTRAHAQDDRSHFYSFGTAGSHLKLKTLFGI